MVFDTIRIYLTENCNANCPFCFNANSRNNNEMDINRFSKMCEYFGKNGVEEIKFMGGEPTVHKNFCEMWEIAQTKFEAVTLFTNGLNNDVLNKIKLRINDSVVYNYKFIQNNKIDKYLFDTDNKYSSRRFEIVLQPNEDISFIINKIYETNRLMIEQGFLDFRFNPTLDCTINPFDEELFVKYNEVYYQVVKFLIENNISFRCDHIPPFCCLSNLVQNLFDKNNINLNFMCAGHIGCAGLVNANFELLHCNQYQKESLQLFNDNNEISLDIHEIKRWLIKQNQNKCNNLLDTKCLDCQYFNTLCNGGCFGHKWKDRFNLPYHI